MTETCFENEHLRLTIREIAGRNGPCLHLDRVEMRTGPEWRVVVKGIPGGEFVTSLGAALATRFEARKDDAGGWELHLSCTADGWEAEETILLPAGSPVLRRQQVYRFARDMEAALRPGFRVSVRPDIRYTLAPHVFEQPLSALKPLRPSVSWALPFPCHVWHGPDWVAVYGLDKSVSAGSLAVAPKSEEDCVEFQTCFPDVGPASQGFPFAPGEPGLAQVKAGGEVALHEFLGARPLAEDEEPLLEAERIAAGELLGRPHVKADLKDSCGRIAAFYERCELWEPDALGPGRGWFSNMWVRTQTGPAKKRGEMSGYYDLGWGEGIAIEMMMGAVRHWQRTGDVRLLGYVDEMTRSIERFRRGTGADTPYFDRSDGQRFGDFLMDHVPGSRIWTHSLGRTGSQLIQLHLLAADYPNPLTRRTWLSVTTSIGRFLAQRQRPDGDLQDIFDEEDREVNRKPHRIAARAVVCGLWTRLAEALDDAAWVGKAQRLAVAVAPEIERYEFYNQMLDGIYHATAEFTDGEAAYYVLEGLAPLYAATRDPGILSLCRKAAAYGIAWTYFYDLPAAHKGIARGGQCCRMPDFPLLYPIGPAKAMEPLLSLYDSTGDTLFEKMAGEMATFIGHWVFDAPGQPWDGGMVHALAQYCGKHWGPDLAGQVDTGMATGNSLAAMECWLAHVSPTTEGRGR